MRRPGDNATGFESRTKGYVVLYISKDAITGTDNAGTEAFLVGGADQTFSFGFGASVLFPISTIVQQKFITSAPTNKGLG